jgi:hypothetical protein
MGCGDVALARRVRGSNNETSKTWRLSHLSKHQEGLLASVQVEEARR